MLLALDTATRIASVALHDGQRLLSEATWHAERQHTVELLPHVVRMLEQAKVAPSELDVVAVAVGPGSFTGLRVALSVAKGMALARDVALLGVPTLDVVAFPHRDQRLPVCAMVQAGRGRLCWALFGWLDGLWSPQDKYRIDSVATVAEAVAATGRETLFAGEISPDTAATLRERLGARARLLLPAETLRRAGYLAELAWERYRRGERDVPASLAPIYLHELGAREADRLAT
jgi:tRNA threonylcarbamoyladenosine biosynthesis protein TsaB